MKKLTKLWSNLVDCLADVSGTETFSESVYNKFDEIFDLKDVAEYKSISDYELFSPAEFKHTSQAMRRAFVEGYLLAQAERKKEDIITLKKCFEQEIPNEKDIISSTITMPNKSNSKRNSNYN